MDKTWPFMLREEQRLRAFDNTVLRKILGLKREEASGDRTELPNEKLHGLYSSLNTIQAIT
jgi:hypothetical protein